MTTHFLGRGRFRWLLNDVRYYLKSPNVKAAAWIVLTLAFVAGCYALAAANEFKLFEEPIAANRVIIMDAERGVLCELAGGCVPLTYAELRRAQKQAYDVGLAYGERDSRCSIRDRSRDNRDSGGKV